MTSIVAPVAVDRVGDGAVAARDTLLRLLGIVTHDLNNPLQSLIVLLELSVDDAPIGSEARVRAEQCQLAADRLRGLTAALSAVLRGRPEDAPQVWARAQALFGSRLDRSGVTTQCDLTALAEVILPAACFFILCATFLLLLASCERSLGRGHQLVVTGTLEGDRAVLAVGLLAPDPACAAPAWNEAAAARLRALVAAEPDMVVAVSPGRIRLVVPPEKPTT